MNTIITSTWDAIIQYFFPAFTAPTTEVFLNLITGWILCTARHTITGILPFADPNGKRSHDAYHRFFPDATWAMSELYRLLTILLVRIFYPTGVIPTDLDDTLFHRSGRKVNGAGWWRDAVRSTATNTVHAWGLNLVVITLRTNPPWGGEPLGLPINMRLHRKNGPTLIELAGQMLTEVALWLPQRRFLCSADGFYASLAGQDIPQTWKGKGPERAAALSLWIYSAVWLWYLQQKSRRRYFFVQPWYSGKTVPSFADALSCLRRVLWRYRIKFMFGKRFVHNNNFEFLIEALATAA